MPAMEPFGQYCPTARAAEILGDRWAPLIVRELLSGATGFNQLYRQLPRISRSILAGRLRRLEREGILYRRIGPNGRASAYELTPAGRALQGVVDTLGEWGARWASGQPRPEERDPVLLLWWMRRRIDPALLPAHRVVVEFDFSGARNERMWLVLEPEDVSVCLNHPGFTEDLIVRADVEAMFQVWLGSTNLARAMDSGTVRIEGPPRLADAFLRWVAGVDIAGALRAAT